MRRVLDMPNRERGALTKATPASVEERRGWESPEGLLPKDIPQVDPQVVREAEAGQRFLGKGSFGACYLTQGEDGIPLCVKIVNRNGESNEKVIAELCREARQMLKAREVPGVIRLVGVSLRPSPAIVMHYGGETLKDFITGEVSGPVALSMLAQIVHIVSRLTKANLCHADLKSNNIVVRQTEEEGPRVTIIDLGIMHSFGYNLDWKGMKANRNYAPEIFEGSPLSTATQVYQVGRIIEVLLKSTQLKDEGLQRLAVLAKGDEAGRPTIDQIFEYVKLLCAIRSVDWMSEEEKKKKKEKKMKKKKMMKKKKEKMEKNKGIQLVDD